MRMSDLFSTIQFRFIFIFNGPRFKLIHVSLSSVHKILVSELLSLHLVLVTLTLRVHGITIEPISVILVLVIFAIKSFILTQAVFLVPLNLEDLSECWLLTQHRPTTYASDSSIRCELAHLVVKVVNASIGLVLSTTHDKMIVVFVRKPLVAHQPFI